MNIENLEEKHVKLTTFFAETDYVDKKSVRKNDAAIVDKIET